MFESANFEANFLSSFDFSCKIFLFSSLEFRNVLDLKDKSIIKLQHINFLNQRLDYILKKYMKPYSIIIRYEKVTKNQNGSAIMDCRITIVPHELYSKLDLLGVMLGILIMLSFLINASVSIQVSQPYNDSGRICNNLVIFRVRVKSPLYAKYTVI